MIEYKGVKWYFYQGALLPRVPPHREIYLSRSEQKELLKRSKALFLRYTNEWNREGGEFWYVIKDSFDGMEELSSNTRSKVRRGQKRNAVRRVDVDYIVQNGYEVYRRAFGKYKTFIRPMNQKQFETHVRSMDSREYWGVFDRESKKLIAYSENFIEEDMCHYSTIKFHPEFLKNYTSYILIHEMNRYYLEEKKMRYVNDGARSISHETNVQTFLLEKFKFSRAYVRLNIAYRWDIGLVVKVLYPLKSIISKIDYPVINKLSVMLKQESIRRSFG